MASEGLAAEVVASIKDPRVVAARRGMDDRTLFPAEGARMLRQALETGAAIDSILFLDPLREEGRELYEEVRGRLPVARAARGIFYKVLGLGYETATEVLGLVRVPTRDPAKLLEDVGRRTDACYLLGEGIQDPRNVGVLVRTADAFSAAAFVVSADSAFPWSRQSVRSSTGSIFRVPIYVADDLPGVAAALRERGVRLVGSSASGSVDCTAADYPRPCAVLVGNETTGLSARLRDASDLVVRIAMSGGAHSLNVTVAAGILLHEVARRRTPP